jgi:hypothetical protein
VINDYPTLQAAVASWLARADLTASIPELIQMAEIRINDDIQSPRQMTTLGFTTSGGTVALPSDFLDAYAVTLSIGGENVPIQPLTPTDALRMDIAGLPVGYYIDNQNLQVSGGSDYAGSLLYRAKVPVLTDAEPTNWLLLSRPNIYLYATLLEAAPFIQDDDRIAVWSTGYSEAVKGFNAQSDRSRYQPAPRMRVDFRAP